MDINSTKYVKDTYEKITDEYTKEYVNDFSDAPYIDSFLSYLPVNASILDVGSGPGQFSDYMQKKGFTVQAIDTSPAMLKVARAKFPNVEFSEMDMRTLDFPENNFDGLLVAYSLIHVPSYEIDNVLHELNGVLKVGGYMHVIAQQGETDQVVDEPLKAGEKIFVNFFSLELLTKHLTDAKFEIIEAKEVDSFDPNSLSTGFLSVVARKK